MPGGWVCKMAKAQVRLVAAEGETPAARSPARETLAAAIARHAEAAQYLERVRAAAARAQRLAFAADADVEKAAEMLAQAQANEGALLAESILAGDRELKASPVAKAEEVMAKAKSHLRRSREAANLVKLEIPRAEERLQWAQEERDKAIAAVIAEALRGRIKELLAAAQRVQDDLVSRRVALRYFHRNGLIAEPDVEQATRNFLINNHSALPGTTASTEWHNWDDHLARLIQLGGDLS
jgi:hypothetical protein